MAAISHRIFLVNMPNKPENPNNDETTLTGGGRTAVSRLENVVHRETGPWAPSVHALLKHLENEGFDGAPRVVGSGFDERGRETLSYIEGDFVHPGPWSDDKGRSAKSSCRPVKVTMPQDVEQKIAGNLQARPSVLRPQRKRIGLREEES